MYFHYCLPACHILVYRNHLLHLPSFFIPSAFARAVTVTVAVAIATAAIVIVAAAIVATILTGPCASLSIVGRSRPYPSSS